MKAPKWNDIFLEQISNDDGREMVAKEILTGKQNDIKGPPLTKNLANKPMYDAQYNGLLSLKPQKNSPVY